MVKRTLTLIFLFITGTGFGYNSSPIPFYFEKFPYIEKLPSNSVIRIYNDKEGYMWFGTIDGLCRFDGYNVKVFRSSALTPGKLTNNEIQCITEDNDNKLWVGTIEGVNIVDKKNYSIYPLENEYVKKERINSILFDSKGFIWIGTANYGAIRMNPKTGEFIRFSVSMDSRLKLKSNNIIQIYEDHIGRIWISMWKNGLCCIDQSLDHINYAPIIGNSNNPFRLYQDKDGLYWICTWGDGIFTMTFDKLSNIIIKPIVLAKDSERKIDDIVYSITQDDTYGYIWVVTFNGLRLIEKLQDSTARIINTETFFDESTNKLFHEIIKDRRGNLWIGSVGEGIYKMDFNKLSIQNFPLNEIKATINVPSYITRFCELPTGDIFIVINRIGLFHFNPASGEVKRPSDSLARSIRSISAMAYISSSNEIWIASEGEDLIRVFKNKGAYNISQVYSFYLGNFVPPRENNISVIFEDSKKNVWIGTNAGVYIKNTNSQAKLISSNIQNVNAISEDANKNIWIGTDKDGVFLGKPLGHLAKTTYSFSKIPLNFANYQSFNVQSICCTKSGDVYIGTKEGCLYFYDKQKRVTTDISGLYGITDEGIMDILEDDFGMLWLSTIKRIIRYNPQTHTATYYSSTDGMLMTLFFKDARIKLKTGHILFGGNKGICMFDPSALGTSAHSKNQRVLITDILIQNKSLFDDPSNSHYNSKKNRVILNHTESNLNIEFSALDYSSANKIQYAYMLSGIDNNWIYVGNQRRFVNYANLPQGKYLFKVKASDENGLWSDQIASLEILILPPPYKTWWAYLIYLVLLVSISYFIFKTIVNRIRLRNELKISHIEKEKSEELAQIKLRYFTNISHELLTPLTIIMLLIEKIQKNANTDNFQLGMLKANANRLKRLIQQILVFRKTESGNIKLKISENDIIAFVNNICQSNFNPLIVEKNIRFSVTSEHNRYLAWFDPDKLDKVLYNLLSNAFKYTPRGGEIGVKISFINRQNIIVMRLSVSDTGEGISDDDLPNIFKRFYTSSKSDPSQSHGIGLSLTKDLLQIHKGNIEVKSELGEGSVFTIEIPVSKEAYTNDELSVDEDLQPEILQEMQDVIPSDDIIELEDETSDNNSYCILVVEDNKELKNLIVENFEKKYKVFSAENGRQALDIIRQNDVDLVISDVMMPEMDGLTFCKILKNDVATSHISILMLTARNSTEDRIACYNAGADAYIAKPFELRLLVARAKSLIGKRKETTEHFKNTQEINISSMEYSSIDEEFLKQAILKVETKLSDVTFDFDQFAEDLGTSKSTLHRKLKSLTGLAPGEFIRNIRLKHASQMIVNHKGNISEIAYAVGFNDPKYFTKCFKAEFGLTPTEYLESKKISLQ
jgi:signal transduction histidine kinase/ligand-binding sensor domain-containing protein/DNA-binding response OmpR family regulator